MAKIQTAFERWRINNSESTLFDYNGNANMQVMKISNYIGLHGGIGGKNGYNFESNDGDNYEFLLSEDDGVMSVNSSANVYYSSIFKIVDVRWLSTFSLKIEVDGESMFSDDMSGGLPFELRINSYKYGGIDRGQEVIYNPISHFVGNESYAYEDEDAQISYDYMTDGSYLECEVANRDFLIISMNVAKLDMDGKTVEMAMGEFFEDLYEEEMVNMDYHELYEDTYREQYYEDVIGLGTLESRNFSHSTYSYLLRDGIIEEKVQDVESLIGNIKPGTKILIPMDESAVNQVVVLLTKQDVSSLDISMIDISREDGKKYPFSFEDGNFVSEMNYNTSEMYSISLIIENNGDTDFRLKPLPIVAIDTDNPLLSYRDSYDGEDIEFYDIIGDLDIAKGQTIYIDSVPYQYEEQYKLIDGKLYDGSSLNVGYVMYDGKLYNGSSLNVGYVMYDGKLYNDSSLNVGYAMYSDEKNTDYNDWLFLDGDKNVGFALYDGKLYNNELINSIGYILYGGVLYNGSTLNEGHIVFERNLYNGSTLNEGYIVFEGNLYNGSTLNEGYIVFEDLLYLNSRVSVGIVEYNGDDYIDGVLKPKSYQLIDGELYIGSSPNVGYVLFENKLYDGSKLNVGYKIYDGNLFNNESLNTGYALFDGELYNGYQLNTGYALFDGELYNGYQLNTGYTLFENNLFNNESLNTGYALFENNLYNNESLNTGYALFDGKLYKEDTLYSGEYDNKSYNNGLLYSGYSWYDLEDKGRLYYNGYPYVEAISLVFDSVEKLFVDGVYNRTGLYLYNDKLFNNELLNSDTVLHNDKLYSGYSIYNGVVEYNNAIYIDGVYNTDKFIVYLETLYYGQSKYLEYKYYNETLYYNAVKFTGIYDKKAYRNGVLYDGYYVYETKTKELNTLYVDGLIVNGIVVYDNNVYLNGSLYNGTQKMADGTTLTISKGEVIENNNPYLVTTAELKKGDYVFSLDFNPSVDIKDKTQIGMLYSQLGIYSISTKESVNYLKNTWHRISKKIAVESDGNYSVVVNNNLNLVNGKYPKISFRAIQIERGTMATDWSISDNDSKSIVDKLEKEVNKTFTEIKQTQEDISLSVSTTKSGVVSLINASKEGVKIKGDKIEIDGNTKLTGTLNVNDRFMVDMQGNLVAVNGTFSGNITGSTITGNSIVGGSITGGNISGGNISGSTINGGSIYGATISGSTISSYGSLVHGNVYNSTSISGGNLSITGVLTRNLYDSNSKGAKTLKYDSIISVSEGYMLIRVTNKMNSSYGNLLDDWRGLYYTEKGIGTTYESLDKSYVDSYNGGDKGDDDKSNFESPNRYIDFFARETYNDGFKSSGMKIYSGQTMDIASKKILNMSSDSSIVLDATKTQIGNSTNNIAIDSNNLILNANYYNGGIKLYSSGVITLSSETYTQVDGLLKSSQINDSIYLGSASIAIGSTFNEATANTSSPSNTALGSATVYAPRVYGGALYDSGNRVASQSWVTGKGYLTSIPSTIGTVTINYLYLGGAFSYSAGYLDAIGGSTSISKNTVKANTVTNLSNAEFKKNIRNWEHEALPMILSTPIREYQYKTENDGEFPHLGVIVQESPVWVITLDGDGVEPYKMATLGWKAIQEINPRIVKLEEDNKAMKLEIQELRELVQSLINK